MTYNKYPFTEVKMAIKYGLGVVIPGWEDNQTRLTARTFTYTGTRGLMWCVLYVPADGSLALDDLSVLIDAVGALGEVRRRDIEMKEIECGLAIGAKRELLCYLFSDEEVGIMERAAQ